MLKFAKQLWANEVADKTMHLILQISQMTQFS